MSTQKKSESFVLIYEWLKVIVSICLPIHIQNINYNRNNDEKYYYDINSRINTYNIHLNRSC